MRKLLPLALLLATLPASARTLGSLEFTDCELAQPGTGATTRAQCATLDVPEDPAKPEGRRIGLKVALAASRAAEPAEDVVIFFAGGPGQSAIEIAGTRNGQRHRIGNARQLAMVLNQVPGVVENGLFIDICDIVIVGYGDGRVETRDINQGTIEQDRLDFVENDNLFTDLAD